MRPETIDEIALNLRKVFWNIILKDLEVYFLSLVL
jgi:hypothetical protein